MPTLSLDFTIQHQGRPTTAGRATLTTERRANRGRITVFNSNGASKVSAATGKRTTRGWYTPRLRNIYFVLVAMTTESAERQNVFFVSGRARILPVQHNEAKEDELARTVMTCAALQEDRRWPVMECRCLYLLHS